MEQIIKKVTEFVEENRKNILDDLCTLCSIDSVAHKGEDGLPYGKGVDKALATVGKICKNHGIECSVNHSLGYATSRTGEGEKTIGFSHIATWFPPMPMNGQKQNLLLRILTVLISIAAAPRITKRQLSVEYIFRK